MFFEDANAGEQVKRVQAKGGFRRAGLGRLAAIATLVLAAHGAAALEPDKIFEKASQSVFVVRAIVSRTQNYTLGSGVVVAPGKVVTNCHVVEGSDRIRVERGDSKFGATLEFTDAQRDLCQLAVRDLNAPPVALAPASALHIGVRVYAVGAAQGGDLALADGFVTSFRQPEADAPQLQISAPVEAGTPGGGLFDSEARLVGITTDNRPSEAPNRIYGLPAEWVRELPERAKASQEKARLAATAVSDERRKHAGQLGVGDSWTYTLVDMQYKPRDRSRKYVHTVRAVDEKSVTEQIAFRGAVISEFTYTGADNVALLRAGSIEISPFLPLLHPLKPGDMVGAVKIDGPDLKGEAQVVVGGRPWIVETGRVVGTETVTVPAGTFDCLKVTFAGRVHTAALSTMISAMGSYQPFTQTVWYAPTVKRAAKVVTSGPGILDSYELESYSSK